MSVLRSVTIAFEGRGNMAKPVILAVDDDPQVLRAVERDLRRRYARDYRVMRADSGESALDPLGKLKLRASRWPCSWWNSACRG